MFNVKIREIKVVNFKNTKYGELQFPRVLNPDSKDILGVYGQNGSGKTAIIDAMELVQKLMIGKPLLEDAGHYIMANQNYMQVAVSFDMDYKMIEYVVDYEVTIKKEKDKCLIDSEEIKYKKKNEDEISRKKILFKYADSKKKPLTPKFKVDKLSKYSFNDVSNKINIMVINELIRKESKSYLFNSMFMEMLGEYKDEFKEEYCILKGLNRYANINLFIISSENSGAIEFKFFIPVNFKITENNHVSKGEIALMLEKPTFMNDRQLEIVEKIVDCMNIVMKKIIPGMTVEILNLGKEVVDVKDNGEEVILNKLELFSNRDGISIPLKFESHGILKILSILNVLINVYNEKDITLFVDELDAGIFEYLLGELLEVFCMRAKGQLLFTSHNLRILETIPKSNLIFTTTNPENRYIKLTSVKSNNNLRDLYIRTIMLGGQKEELYQETDKIEISKAFGKIGKVLSNG